MHTVGSAISAQNAKARAATTYELPWGFKIEPSNDDRWTHTMTCNNNFVFNGSLIECFIALGGHLNSLR